MHPVGRIDLLCVNDTGGLVIVRIRTSTDSKREGFECKEYEAKQLEFLAILFDSVASMAGVDIGIAETGILYWDKEEDGTHNSKGSSAFCRLARNPSILSNEKDKNRDLCRNMKGFK